MAVVRADRGGDIERKGDGEEMDSTLQIASRLWRLMSRWVYRVHPLLTRRFLMTRLSCLPPSRFIRRYLLASSWCLRRLELPDAEQEISVSESAETFPPDAAEARTTRRQLAIHIGRPGYDAPRAYGRTRGQAGRLTRGSSTPDVGGVEQAKVVVPLRYLGVGATPGDGCVENATTYITLC